MRLVASVVLDWVDEPLEAIVQAADGTAYYAVKVDGPSEAGKVFRLCQLAAGVFDQACDLLQPLGECTTPDWVPAWSFPDAEKQAAVEAQLDRLLVLASDRAVYARGASLTNDELDSVSVAGDDVGRIEKSDDVWDAAQKAAGGRTTAIEGNE